MNANTIFRRLKGLMMKRFPGMITCREFDDFIVDYLEGSLSPSQSKYFERHLLFCKTCRDYLNDYSEIISLSKSAYSAEIPKMPIELVHTIMMSLEKRE